MVTRDQRSFLALEQGTATTSGAIIAWGAGRWRLVGSAAAPAGVDEEAILRLLARRLREADPDLAATLDARPETIGLWPRLAVRSEPPRRIAVVAATERALVPLVIAAQQSGWDVRSASTERRDPLQVTKLALDYDVDAVLVGADQPPRADERSAVGDLGALVSAAATRRSDLSVVLAGGMAEQLPRFEVDPASREGTLVVAAAATAGSPPGSLLRERLEDLRAGTHEGRRALIRAAGTIAEALDRRVEVIDIGLTASTRVVASPAPGGGAATVEARVLSTAGLVPSETDDHTIDRILAWLTISLDRYRLRDRLAELRLAPWADAAGEGADLRLAAARVALARLLESTTELDPESGPDLVVVAGGAWAVVPEPVVALAVSDVLRRPGSRQLAYDHSRLLGALGTVDDPTERRHLVADLASDLLVPLGSVVMPQGMRAGRTAGHLTIHRGEDRTERDLAGGIVERISLSPGQRAVAEIAFRDAVRLGARGKHYAVEVVGGLAGLLIDLRDVPLRLPERADRRREQLRAWQAAIRGVTP